jgi:hypothetical protein
VLTTDEDDLRPFIFQVISTIGIHKTKILRWKKLEMDLYHFKFPHDFVYPEELLYKFTKGDWSEVEIDKYGNRTENRVCKQNSGLEKNMLTNGEEIGCLLSLIFYPKFI